MHYRQELQSGEIVTIDPETIPQDDPIRTAIRQAIGTYQQSTGGQPYGIIIRQDGTVIAA